MEPDAAVTPKLLVAVCKILPLTPSTELEENANVSAAVGVATLHDKHCAFAPTVTVAVAVFELALKKTLSDVVGADAPPAPPEVALQLVLLAESHVPVPPTQNLSAMP
jgi:hypothetical protein